MSNEIETPGPYLEGQPGMKRYYGYIREGLRCRVYIPTTVYDLLVAELRIYKPDDPAEQFPDSPELLIAKGVISLTSMPRWNSELQTLFLSEQDDRKISQALSKLEKKALGKE